MNFFLLQSQFNTKQKEISLEKFGKHFNTKNIQQYELIIKTNNIMSMISMSINKAHNTVRNL